MGLTVQRDATALPAGTAACMGAFDGLHRGHQALIDRAHRSADRVALVTFDPHPAKVLAPARAPRLLQTSVQRERVAAALGIDTLVLLPFDHEMSRLSPEAFVRRYLVEGLRPRSIVVGADFRFGAGAAGDTRVLGELLGEIALHVVEPVSDGGDRKLGSSQIRAAIDRGDVGAAADILGRWHAVHGPVVTGAKRGRAIGFPTANIAVGDAYVPPLGIYATVLAVWDPDAPDYGAVWPSVSSVGRNPTFGEDGPVTVEAYVLDEDLGERLYGVEVELSFVAHLRDEAKFDSVEALVAKIREDCEAARGHLGPDALARALAPPPRRR